MSALFSLSLMSFRWSLSVSSVIPYLLVQLLEQAIRYTHASDDVLCIISSMLICTNTFNGDCSLHLEFKQWIPALPRAMENFITYKLLLQKSTCKKHINLEHIHYFEALILYFPTITTTIKVTVKIMIAILMRTIDEDHTMVANGTRPFF